MVKRGTRKTRRGGAWYTPWTWFSAAPEPITQSSGPTDLPVSSPSVFGSSPSPPENPPYGGKGKGKGKRKTRRGGRKHRSHSRSKEIYGF